MSLDMRILEFCDVVGAKVEDRRQFSRLEDARIDGSTRGFFWRKGRVFPLGQSVAGGARERLYAGALCMLQVGDPRGAAPCESERWPL